MKFAGQLIAENLTLVNDITGDFRYVPFDPPILNIDPTANGGGIYPELNQDQKIDITLIHYLRLMFILITVLK